MKKWVASAAVFSLIGLLYHPVAAEEASRVYSVSNRFFEVISDDPISVQYVNQASRHMQTMVERYFDLPKYFPQQIPIRLISDDDWDSDGDYHTGVEVAGKVTLSIRWAKDTEQDVVLRSLVQAFMVRLIIWHGGGSLAKNFPLWLELALVEELKNRLNPVYQDLLVRHTDALPLMKANAILTHSLPFRGKDRTLALNRFWMLRYLEQEAGSLNRLREVLLSLLTTADPIRAIASHNLSAFESADEFELWWATGFYDLISKRISPIYSLDRSRRLIQSLGTFTLSLHNRDTHVFLHDLWDKEDKATINKICQARLSVLKGNLRAINPIYYNPLLSLGQSLEAFLVGDRSGFQHAYDLFQYDYALANHVAIGIHRYLDRPAGSLGEFIFPKFRQSPILR